MITSGDAALLVQSWADDAAHTDGGEWIPMLEEFEHGYVVWVQPPAGARLEPGASPRQVIDRDTGEITTWGSLPAPMVADQYRRHRQTYPAATPTVDPVATIRRRATRPAAPTTAMHLMLGHDRRLRIAYGAKGDQDLNHHPVIREWLDAQPPGELSRGAERHAEMIVISDVLHAHDVTAGQPTTLEQARRLFRDLIQFAPMRVRPRLPHPVQASSCHSCLSALVHVGLYQPRILDHQEFQQAVISGLDRPDFPAELRPLVGPRGLRTALIDRDTGRDFILTMYPNLLTRPPAIQDIAVRYRPSYQKGSRPGQVHRADAFTLWPGLDVYPELAEDFGRYLGVSAYTIGDESLAESLIVADEHGRVFVLDQAGEWFLGADIDDALVTLFHGREQRRLRDDGTW